MPKISRAAGAAAVLALALGTALAAGACSGGQGAGQRNEARVAAADQAGPGAGAGIGLAPGPGRRLVVRPVLAAGRGGTAAGPAGTGVRPAEASADSLNSAGYAASRGGTRFRLVRATFFVPYLNCALSKGAFSDEWVGLGGFVGKSATVQQDGIQANCTSAGRGTYRAWYDMYPRRQVLSRLRVRAGDSITASVFYDATTNKFSLSLTDNTTGGRFAVSRGCPAGHDLPGPLGRDHQLGPDPRLGPPPGGQAAGRLRRRELRGHRHHRPGGPAQQPQVGVLGRDADHPDRGQRPVPGGIPADSDPGRHLRHLLVTGELAPPAEARLAPPCRRAARPAGAGRQSALH